MVLIADVLFLVRPPVNFFLTVASYNSITYGNLQKISKPNDECEDPDETQALPSCNEHVSMPNFK